MVIVATIRALKYHGGVEKDNIEEENIVALKNGVKNLIKHVENIKSFGLNPIVAINKFNSDTEKEIDSLEKALDGIVEYSLLENWAKGGLGAEDLCKKIIEVCKMPKNFKFTYDVSLSVKEKIEAVAKNIYGAEGVEYSDSAEVNIKEIETLAKNMPVCIAKTQYSLTDDAKNLRCEEPFNIHVEAVELKNGAEFIVVKTGKIMTMPGLPKKPAAENIDLDKNGNIVGIF